MSFQETKRLTSSHLRRFSLVAAVFGAALAEGAYGCSGEEGIESFIEENVGQVSEAVVDEESDVQTGPVCTAGPACTTAITVNTTPSLVVTRSTHAALLDTHFSLSAVLTRILAQSNVGSQTAENLYQRLWDTQSAAPGKFTDAFQPHCTNDGQTVNGFPVACRPGAGALANTPTTNFRPVALFNRFDLTPKSGAHCGEYRVVFSDQSSQAFMIFEGQLPNPNPTCGVEACRPVADFWRNLSTISDPAVLGTELKRFYFDGLTGFRPVIHPNNYGLDGASAGGYGSTVPSGGQIRTNDILHAGIWHLDDFQLGRSCTTGGVCTLFNRRVSVKANPWADLFDPTLPHPLANEFQLDFVAHGPSAPSNVERLAVSTLAGIGLATGATHNAGQSETKAFDNYTSQFGTSANPFRTNIQGELTRIGSSLTPTNIVDRATTQSCAGCHNLSNNKALGGGLTWPPSLSFFHVNSSGQLSSALTGTFLPHRKNVLEGFLQNCTPFVGGKVASGGTATASPDGPGKSTAAQAAAATADEETLGGSTTH